MSHYNFDFDYVSAGAPIVTLSKFGIGFNRLAREALGYPEKVKIGYDKENKVIGVKSLIGETNSKTYEFELKERSGWVRIGCKSFILNLSKTVNLDFVSKAIQFTAKYNKDLEMLIIVVNPENINEL